MDDIRIGRAIRAVRVRRGLRQSDVGQSARVSQQVVSVIERGGLERVGLRTAREVADALGAQLQLRAWWPDADIDRLLGESHALLVERTVSALNALGWQTLVEYSFNHYGDRGSVDVVGWHAVRSALLVVEVKSRIVDVQDLLSTLDRKARVVPGLVARDRGWRARAAGRVVIVPRTTATRTVLSRYHELFAVGLPARTLAVRSWLREPAGPLAALWLVSPTPLASGTPGRVDRRRVRPVSGGRDAPGSCGRMDGDGPGSACGRPSRGGARA